jgi:hypothetical protein
MSRRDPRVDARGRADVRITFARLVRYFDNALTLGAAQGVTGHFL